ncbi:AidB family quorum-quenching N-acyl homoserine lactonase [Agrobacterium tumefaciens]|uniref:AidB family quorum-quenching N-acyl homoserine lactonase n=1 Tax=Agrobacterium tumefaciens TaxID=358 RepID=UPI00045BA04C|nr:MBL fold metallo-hydrolase [Agrobacterium tumefaciens]CDN92268.1 Metal dependent hydrolase [Agrobacterium tumefaciens]
MAISRRFGAYEVSRFVDGVYKAPVGHLIHRQGADALAAALAGHEGETVDMDVNCFALSGPEGIWLIDTGCGTAWGAAYGHARAAMIAAGIQPADVTRVILTHIHGDHALGLIDGDRPYFPNAEIWVPEADLGFFTSEVARKTLPPARQGGFDLAARLLDICGAMLRPIPTGKIADDVEAIAMPGHTPGHTGYLIGKGDERLLLWGDVLHVSALQAQDPGIGFVYDIDSELAYSTRLKALGEVADNDWLVSGGHLGGFFRVEREGDSFRFVPQPI